MSFESISELYSVREQMSALRARETELKDRIHREMNALYTNTISTHDGFVCFRKVHKTTGIRKETVPEHIWREFAQEKDVVQLTVRKL